jgi:hypothetical protein
MQRDDGTVMLVSEKTAAEHARRAGMMEPNDEAAN